MIINFHKKQQVTVFKTRYFVNPMFIWNVNCRYLLMFRRNVLPLESGQSRCALKTAVETFMEIFIFAPCILKST